MLGGRGVLMREVLREALERAAVRHRALDRQLELRPAQGAAGEPLRLVGGERGGEQVREGLVPRRVELEARAVLHHLAKAGGWRWDWRWDWRWGWGWGWGWRRVG